MSVTPLPNGKLNAANALQRASFATSYGWTVVQCGGRCMYRSQNAQAHADSHSGYTDGSTNMVSNDGKQSPSAILPRWLTILPGGVAGNIYYLNFSSIFDTTTSNLTALLNTKQKAGGLANNIAPNYVSGAMFANEDEFYLYG